MRVKCCGNCEYFYDGVTFDNPVCLRTRPTFIEDMDGFRPETRHDLWCEEWEPCWDNDESIKEAWEEFKTFFIMKKGYNNNDREL